MKGVIVHRIACLIVGHRWEEPEPYVTVCGRCDGVWECSCDPADDPWLGLLPWIRLRLPKFVDPRVKCEHCGKKLWRWPGKRAWGETFCSYKCHKDWLPF